MGKYIINNGGGGRLATNTCLCDGFGSPEKYIYGDIEAYVATIKGFGLCGYSKRFWPMWLQ
jgi:hypothetical protein